MLQEIIMKDRIYITGKVKEVLAYLKEYEKEYQTLQGLIKDKLS